ncbi:MAG: hypothetical protein Q9216_002952 [Gyalolechia sp. 2 TL-2023]
MGILALVNARLCHHGALLPPQSVFVDTSTGLILSHPATSDFETLDLHDRILAPAFLELQTNGCVGAHFTNYSSDDEYLKNLEKVSRWMVKRGVGGWWATVPTVDKDLYKKASLAVSISFIGEMVGDETWKRK